MKIILNRDDYRDPKLISAKEAAALLGITSKRLRVLANQDRVELSYFDKDKGWLFNKLVLGISPGARGPAFGLNKVSK